MNELESLKAENRALNEQVKKLVRTERRLSLNQLSLDAQLRRLESVNRFTLEASRAESPEAIVRLALAAVFEIFPYEQGMGFLKVEPGRFKLAAIQYVAGCGCQANACENGGSMTIAREEDLPRAARFGAVQPFLGLLEACFGKGTRPDASLMTLPICLGAELQGVILLRRSTPLSLLERMPSEEDLPFLQLLENHVSTSLKSLLLYRDAREAVRMRDEFLSIASHELKTPMTSMLLLLQSISRDGGDKRELSHSLISQLERQFRRLGGLVDQLLDVSRIQIGKLTPQLAEMDLTETAREVIQRFQVELTRSGSKLRFQAPGPVILRADPLQIEQVITNLVSNAVKFGKGDELEVRVSIEGNDAVLTVRDRGIGIPAQDQKRIFDRFERAVSSRHFGGLGLGLYITRQILEQHGGSIGIESRIGEGSKFTVRLPRNPGALKVAA